MTDYNNSDLAALAREREARRGGPPPAAAASTPLPKSWASRPAAAPPSNLHSVHRSIKLGRAIGLAATFLSILFLVLGFGWRTVLIVFLGGVGVARGGGRLVHGIVPAMLIESGAKPPTDTEIAAAQNAGLFCVEGVKTFGASFGGEYALALDSLAFVCTYGKKNCLTDKMYDSRELTLGKIFGLVWGKVSEGVFRC